MTEAEIKRELQRLAPFHHEIELPYGLSTQGTGLTRRQLDRTRLADLMRRAWSPVLELNDGSLAGRRVLDVACSCGGASVAAARSGAERVVGIDVVERYVEQANFIMRALELDNVEFRQLAIEAVDGSLGTFDVSLCFGLLYHLENPVLAMKRLAGVTERMLVIDTLLDKRHHDKPYWRMNFRGPSDDKTESTSLWRDKRIVQFTPTARAVEALLDFVGFPNVTRIDPGEDSPPPYRSGRWATFIARRS